MQKIDIFIEENGAQHGLLCLKFCLDNVHHVRRSNRYLNAAIFTFFFISLLKALAFDEDNIHILVVLVLKCHQSLSFDVL
jgi:hypothetical protein